ncbi:MULTISPECIES: metal-dependent hydrolase [unclassified Roseovarius]|uniref:metal-dependent hydrolase n=1 Tax=unclassified Roseovarius TaxID=2614913 RepID=UPI00273E8CFB|nr:metal-dependent hydrolase [Roseovarius sp. MMSF_3350]
MITAHLPAGYVTGRAFARSGPVLWAAMLGGVLPDLDLIWFYLIDGRAFHHHHYWVHIPAFWVASAFIVLPLATWRGTQWVRPALAFFAAILVHLLLDTVAGGIKWLWPVRDRFFHLVTVPAAHAHWILNFILHPVFLAELAIWAAALLILLRRSPA